MDVGSTINIYGNLFGWHVYDMMFDFFIATGLWLIPFFLIFFKIFTFAGFGESDKYNPTNALVAMERYVYPAILVYAVFFLPTVDINKRSFTYNDGAKVQSVGNTKTTFDRYQDMVPNKVTMPIGWYLTLQLTSGINGVMNAILPNQFQARDLLYSLQQVELDDPQVQAELNEFNKHCKVPAQARLNAIRTRFPDSKMAKKLSDYQKDTQASIKGMLGQALNALSADPGYFRINEKYAGNMYFQNWLYDDSLLCKRNDDPNTKLCIPLTGNPLTPPASQGNCVDWWGGKGYTTTNGKLLEKVNLALGGTKWDVTVDDDGWVAARLDSLGVIKKGSEKGVGNKEGSWWQWGEEKSAGLMLNLSNIINSATNSAVRFALPIAQGMVLMIVFMLLAIFIIFGKYNLEDMAGIAVLLFGVSFLTSIWTIIGWIDNVMLNMMLGGPKSIVQMAADAFSLELAVWNVLIFSSYAAASFFWLRYIASVGGSAAGAISLMFDGASGAGSTISKGNQMRKRGQRRLMGEKKKN